MRVRVMNIKSHRCGEVGVVKERDWQSNEILIPVRIGRDECLFYRWSLAEI